MHQQGGPKGYMIPNRMYPSFFFSLWITRLQKAFLEACARLKSRLELVLKKLA